MFNKIYNLEIFEFRARLAYDITYARIPRCTPFLHTSWTGNIYILYILHVTYICIPICVCKYMCFVCVSVRCVSVYVVCMHIYVCVYVYTEKKIRRYRHNYGSFTYIILEIYRKPRFACINSACMYIPTI